MDRIDVAIVGAGAAGLTAAGELRRKGFEVAVFEARDRIGGRILTHRDPRVPLPIELGAEFIHGEAPETTRRLSETALLACDIVGEHWRAESGKLRRAEDFWEKIDPVLSRIDRIGEDGPDLSFSEFLARKVKGSSLARNRAAAREFVQGFHAADVDEISTLSIAPEEGEAPSESAARMARVVQGYDRLPQELARDLGDVIRLSTPVTEVAWQRGGAELTLQPEAGPEAGGIYRVHARAAVITLPVGVLQARPEEPGGLRLSPDPPRVHKALDRIVMGSVLRIAFWFREFPWEQERLSFLHLGGGPFNVWWSAYPLRWPLAVAWSGGPPAKSLAGRTREEIKSTALAALAEQLGVSTRRVKSRVLGAWSHDWDADPHSRGAYSYARVGGAEAAKTLARPVEGTLFFAGEATDVEGRTGTVEGAIATGLRAARQVGAALKALD
jgi:monoamine oxidase